MRGPSGRLRHRIRRLWRCRLCGLEEWTDGRVVNRRCRCTPADASPPVWMTLVEPPSKPSKPIKPDDPAPSETGA